MPAQQITSNRILALLNLLPWTLSTTLIVKMCSSTLRCPRTSTYQKLSYLERKEKIRCVTRGTSGRNHRGYWKSTKWFQERELTMADAVRDKLPARRRCVTQTVKVDDQTVHYSIGLYEDGRPGELFVDVSKAGAALRTWAGEAAMMLSIALQHGTPLDTVLRLFIGTRCEPCGQVKGHSRITQCTSIMDLIARDMAITFLDRQDLADYIDGEHQILLLVESTHPQCSCHIRL